MTDFSRHNLPILAAHYPFLKRKTRTIPWTDKRIGRASLKSWMSLRSLGCGTGTSKVQRGTLINHVQVAAVTSPTFNEFLHIFPTQSLKHVIIGIRFYNIQTLQLWLNVYKESITITEYYRPEEVQRYLCHFLVVNFHRVPFKQAASHWPE